MLERALSKTFTEMATLLLVASVFTVPLYMIHAFIFRNVHAVAELSPDIREFPEGRQVRGVAASDLELERTTLWIVSLGALALVVLIARAAARVQEVVDEGGVPSVRDALRHMARRDPRRASLLASPLVAGAIVALVFASLVLKIGGVLTSMGSNDMAWPGTGLTRAVAMATFLAILGGCLAAVRGAATPAPAAKEPIDLY